MAQRVERRVIPYKPRSIFLPYHERAERFACVLAHRRFGKTVGTINDQIKRAVCLTLENGRYAYIAPFLNQAKDVAWGYLKHYAAPILAKPPNEGDLWVELINGARIRIYGADNPDRLRGIYLDGVVLDEYADMHPSIWGEIIRPLLADRQGWATFIGTPKGRNSFWEIYDRSTRDPNWFSMMLRASETGVLPGSELEDAAKDMTPEQYDQEFECSFDAAIMGAYFGKEIAEAERAGRVTEVPYDPLLPVHTSWDLGKRDSTAIWMFQIVGNEIRWIDFYENHGEDPEHYVKVLNARGYKFGTDWLPHDARVKLFGMKRTRVEQMIDLKREPKIIPDHKIMDGINAARMTLKRSYFDKTACALGLEALRQYRADYDEKTRAFRDQPKHDWTSHCADAFRYGSMAWREIAPPPPVAQDLPLKGISGMTFDQAMKKFRRPTSARIS